MQDYNKTLWQNNVTVIDADKLNNIENQMDALTRNQGEDAKSFAEVRNMIALKANMSHSHEKYESEIAILDQEFRQLKAEIEGTAKYFDEVRLNGLTLEFCSNGDVMQSITLPSNVSPTARAMCGEFLAGELNCGDNVANYSLDSDTGTVWVDGQTPVNAENLNKIETKLANILNQLSNLEDAGIIQPTSFIHVDTVEPTNKNMLWIDPTEDKEVIPDSIVEMISQALKEHSNQIADLYSITEFYADCGTFEEEINTEEYLDGGIF